MCVKQWHSRPKGNIRMMKSQRGDTEKDKLIEEGKRIGIGKIIRQNNGNSQSKKIIFLTHI